MSVVSSEATWPLAVVTSKAPLERGNAGAQPAVPAGFVEENLELSGTTFFLRGGETWILLCWAFCTAVGVLKVLVGLDKFPSFIDELKHQHVDPLVNLKADLAWGKGVEALEKIGFI
eukprot:Skav209414  [mRNA]  locus=scaffold1411:71044:73817:+ [translate_table: standard]